MADAAISRGWHVTDCRHQKRGQIRIFSPLYQVANVLASGPRPEADARLIVRAANEYDALREIERVLREARPFLGMAVANSVGAQADRALADLEEVRRADA